jgi:uncharacterized membrane protein
MLVPLPIGLWVFSLVCDVVAVAGGDPAWRTVAFYTMAGGLVGALAAAVPGLVDLLSLGGAPRKTAVAHMAINLTVVALFAVNLWLRATDRTGALTLALSAIGIALLAASGWLGGKMVYEYRVGVAEQERSPPR